MNLKAFLNRARAELKNGEKAHIKLKESEHEKWVEMQMLGKFPDLILRRISGELYSLERAA